MKRLFVAIKIDPAEKFRKIYADLQARLKGEQLKWVDLKNMHITLKFIGETSEDQIPSVIHALEKTEVRHTAFDFNLKGTGIFGSQYNPRVIWFGTTENKELCHLAEDTLAAFDEIGMQRDRQNLVPHLTIARIKEIGDKKRFQTSIGLYKTEDIQPIHVHEFILYESILKPSGPEYYKLKVFGLKGTGPVL